MDSVVIGADPHKRSVTIEILDEREQVLHQARHGTDTDGYRRMLSDARQRYPRRRWAIEGCNGAGKHVAQRLVADREHVVDVPAKLAARVRVFDTGNGRKSDPADAHSVAVVALRTRDLTVVRPDDELVALRLRADRRDELARTRTQTINRLHRMLLELVPGGAKRFLSAAQAKSILDRMTLAEGDVAGQIRHQIAHELLAEVVVLDRKIKESDKMLRKAVAATGTGLLGLYEVGPAGAARILGDVLDVARFPTRARFASWNGTAPLDASSGEQRRHRLSRAGNRRINRALHIMAVVQLRHDTPGRAYFRRRLAEGKTSMEAIRALKRQLSDVVYRQLVADARKASPGGHTGAATTSSATGPTPTAGSSDKSLPGPDCQPTPAGGDGHDTPAPSSKSGTAARRLPRQRAGESGPSATGAQRRRGRSRVPARSTTGG